MIPGSSIYRTECRNKFILIEISDTGEGIAGENLSKVYSPDYSGKPAGKETGLGPASVKTMVEEYSGVVEMKVKIG